MLTKRQSSDTAYDEENKNDQGVHEKSNKEASEIVHLTCWKDYTKASTFTQSIATTHQIVRFVPVIQAVFVMC